ncbi:MAG: NAD-dependent epimerase/dehydratase family protein [Chloroflexota bacterium]
MILVTGATGFVGRQLIERLMADGRHVRCLLTEEKAVNLPWSNPPEVVIGDLLDEEALFRAVTGVHTIIHLQSGQWWGRIRDLERIELVGTRNLIAAGRAARVGRIMTISQLGASTSSAYMLLRIKGMVEEQVRSSGLAYTIIRAGLIFGDDDAFVNHIAMTMRTTPFIFLMPGRGEVVLHPLYIDDLIEAIVRSLESIDIVDTTVDFGGPEYITLEDLIRTVMRVSGIYRFIIPVAPYAMRWIAAIYSRIFRRSLVTPQWLDILATNRTAPLGNAFNYFGIQPRRFEDTLLTYMPGKGYFWPTFRYMLRRRPKGI